MALSDLVTNAGDAGYTMLVDGQGTSRELDAIKAQGTITPNPNLGQRIQAVTGPAHEGIDQRSWLIIPQGAPQVSATCFT